ERHAHQKPDRDGANDPFRRRGERHRQGADDDFTSDDRTARDKDRQTLGVGLSNHAGLGVLKDGSVADSADADVSYIALDNTLCSLCATTKSQGAYGAAPRPATAPPAGARPGTRSPRAS